MYMYVHTVKLDMYMYAHVHVLCMHIILLSEQALPPQHGWRGEVPSTESYQRH